MEDLLVWILTVEDAVANSLPTTRKYRNLRKTFEKKQFPTEMKMMADNTVKTFFSEPFSGCHCRTVCLFSVPRLIDVEPRQVFVHV